LGTFSPYAILTVIGSCRPIAALTGGGSLGIDGITSKIDFENAFDRFDLYSEGDIELTAAGNTNLFNNPSTRENVRTAPIAWLTTRRDKFVFGATIRAELSSTFDAAGLVVACGNAWWAKLVHEMSPEGDRTIVSVVSSPFSDDSNGPLVEFDRIKLRIANDGDAIAMHWTEHNHWRLARFTPRPTGQPLAIGLIAHSSLGTGCRARISSLFLHTDVPADFRSGE